MRAENGTSIFVSPEGDNSDGTTWSAAYTSLQDALDIAGANDVILLAGRTFALQSQVLLDGKSGLVIRGGFEAANDDDLPGAQSSQNWPTILDAGKNNFRVMRITSVDSVTIKDVTFTGGAQVYDANNLFGGGILAQSSSNLLFSNCVIVANLADQNVSGGGIALQNSSVTLDNCLIQDNTVKLSSSTVARHGGGIYLASGTANLNNCIIAHNRLSGGYTRYGGGISSAGTLQMKNCLVIGNSSAGYGDGISISGGSAALANCTIADNTGKGLQRANGAVTMKDSIIRHNGLDIVGDVNIAFSNVGTGGGAAGASNISADPMFERGYYLATNSPSCNSGSDTAEALGLDGLTTRTDGAKDSATADMGYHYHAGYDCAGADLYVAVDGSDANSGDSWESPLRSVTEAVARAKDGRHIHVGCGTYDATTETFPITLALKKGVCLLAENPETTILKAGGAGTRVMTIDSSARCRIKNFTLTGGRHPGGGGGIGIIRSGGILFDGCVVTNNATSSSGHGGGILSEFSETTLMRSIIKGNVLKLSGTVNYYGGGIYATGALTMDGCVVANNSFSGGYTKNGAGLSVNATALIRNTLITGNSGANLGGNGIYAGGGAIDIENCAVADNSIDGIKIGGGAVKIVNTIVWGNTNNLDGNATLQYSNVEGNDNGGLDGCISADPMFVDAGKGNYQINPISPCVGSGTNLPWIVNARDLAKNKRLIGGFVDMGAYECQVRAGTRICLR